MGKTSFLSEIIVNVIYEIDLELTDEPYGYGPSMRILVSAKDKISARKIAQRVCDRSKNKFKYFSAFRVRKAEVYGA